MTRNRKIDPEVLEREYIYDRATRPVSIRVLAERHGLAPGTVAVKASKGKWNDRRVTFRENLAISTDEKLVDEWVKFETAAREKSMTIGLKLLEKFEKQLDDPEFKVSTRDMVAVASMVRTLAIDAAAKVNGEVELHDPDTADLSEDFARRVLDATELRRIGPGQEAPPAGAEGAGAD